MSINALDSEVITAIRAEIPEFEDRFQAVFCDEDGETESFQAMIEFATWLQSRIDAPGADPEVQRSFATIEHIATSRRFQLSSALVAEFVEATAHNPEARALMGPNTHQFLE